MILSFSILATSCADSGSSNKDKNPPVLKTNLSVTNPINSDKPIALDFDEPIKTQSINQTNVALQDDKGNPIDLKKYEVKQDEKDKKKIIITLNDELKNKTAIYKIKLQNLTDEAGNKLTAKTLDIKLLDSVAPNLTKNNLDASSKSISSSKTLVLEFSEALKPETVNQTHIVLKDKNRMALSAEQYEVAQDTDNKARVNIKLTDETLKNQTADYTLEVSNVTDEPGNRSTLTSITFRFIDSVDPTYSKSNINVTTKSLSSNDPLKLTFSENLKESQIDATNFILKQGATVLTKDQYSIEQKNGVLEIKLTDEALKNQTADYTLEVKSGLTDESGNPLVTTIDPISFKFEDKIAPTYKTNNLNYSKEINTSEILVLEFSEALKSETVNQTKITLQDKSGANVDTSDYKVELDSQAKNKVNISLTKNLRKITAEYSIKISGVEDLAGNAFKDASATEKTISFKFLADEKAPRFIGSNVFDKKIFQGTNKIVLLFNEEIDESSKNLIFIKKGSSSFTNFTASLGSDKKSIEISFTSGLNSISSAYKIKIPNTIIDLADNKLENPQTLEVENVFDTTSDTIFVASNGAGNKDGTSWANARTLNKALEVATSGKTILVAQGSYYADRYNEGKSFNLVEGVKIYGGFATDSDYKNKPRNFEASILEGDLGYYGHTKQILKGYSLSTDTVLDGFVIQNALNNYYSYYTKGAGLYLSSSKPKLANLVFKNNKSTSSGSKGGAIYNDSSSPSISNSVFTSNSASSGGAIYNDDSSPSISNSVFSDNSSGSDGGAIYNDDSSPSISNSTFTGNSSYFGGAIYNFSSSPSISNSTFTANSANYGNAIYNSSSSPSISNSILWNNKNNSLWWAPTVNIYNNGSSSNPTIKNSILNKDSVTSMSGNSNIDTSATSNNKTPTSFVLESDGRVVDANSKALIKDKGDNTLYLKVYNKINGTSETTIPATDKDLAGNPRLQGTTIDIGAYEVQY